MSHGISAIDLFAGAGGFSLSAKNNGMDVLAAIELDHQAATTYAENLIDVERDDITSLINEDINEVCISKLMADKNIEKGQLDLLLGGPPCQGFSSHRINDAGINDPRNKLILRYFDFINELRPKVFLVENVPGLLWKKHEKFVSQFLKLSKQSGYKIVGGEPIIINAKDYGVPQNRRRAFILGVRADIDSSKMTWPPLPTHFSPASSFMPKWKAASTVFEKPSDKILKKLVSSYQRKNKCTLKIAEQIVNGLQFGLSVDKNDPCNIHMKHTESVAIRFKQTPLNGSREDLDFRLACHENYKGHKDVYGRVFFHTPSNTITTGCNNPSKGRFVHLFENHGITLRHAARLQTFPDSFMFTGSTTEQARQIGNAVPIELGRLLIKSIKEQLLIQPELKIAI